MPNLDQKTEILIVDGKNQKFPLVASANDIAHSDTTPEIPGVLPGLSNHGDAMQDETAVMTPLLSKLKFVHLAFIKMLACILGIISILAGSAWISE